MMSDLLTRSHSETMRLPLYLLVRELVKNLGPTLVAYLANVRSRQMPAKWATLPTDPSHVEPRDDAKQRLQVAYQVFHALDEAESEHVARQWLLGANPRFSGQAPAQRIREGAFGDVYGALEAFISDTSGA